MFAMRKIMKTVTLVIFLISFSIKLASFVYILEENKLCCRKSHCTKSVKSMKFSIKDFFSKCDQIRRKLRIWSHLLKKSLNFIFCAVSRFPSNIPLVTLPICEVTRRKERFLREYFLPFNEHSIRPWFILF